MVKVEIDNLKQYKQGGKVMKNNDPVLKQLKRDLEEFYALRKDSNIEPSSVRIVPNKNPPRAKFKIEINSDVDDVSQVINDSAQRIARLGFMSDIQDVKKNLRFK